MICYVRTNKRGYGGAAPMKKKRCHPEAASADRLPPKDLVPTELFLGRRGAVTKWSVLQPPGHLVCAPKLHSDHHTSD